MNKNEINSVTKKRNYIVRVMVAPGALSPEKSPPLCDACSSPFVPDHDTDTYIVTALILNNGIWGLLCEACINKHFQKMPVMTAKEAPKAANAVEDVLCRPAKLIFF